MPAVRSAVLLALLLAGCGENRRDVYAKGLAVEAQAEGACQVHYEKAIGASVINGDIIAECLRLTELALTYYDQAAQMGFKEVDFTEVHERARDRKERLGGMLKMVREMERDQVKQDARIGR